MINRLRIVSVLLLVASNGLAADLPAALDRAGANRAQIQAALDGVPVDQRAGMEWLVTHMP